MKTVTFQLKGEYIDQIKKGTKKEEYRDLSGYNIKRLCYLCDRKEIPPEEDYLKLEGKCWRIREDITHVQFFNGYRKDRKELVCEVKSIRLEEDPEGDAPGVDLFVLSLGKIVRSKNF